jgi:hypothetical protein
MSAVNLLQIGSISHRASFSRAIPDRASRSRLTASV